MRQEVVEKIVAKLRERPHLLADPQFLQTVGSMFLGAILARANPAEPPPQPASTPSPEVIVIEDSITSTPKVVGEARRGSKRPREDDEPGSSARRRLTF